MSSIRLGQAAFPVRALPLLSALLFSGCGSLVGGAPPPDVTSVRRPPADFSTTVLSPEPHTLETLISEPNDLFETSEPLPADPILESPWVQTEEMEVEIQRWIESFQTREAPLFRATLARMGKYRGMVDGELRARRLPPSLAFLPIVESWYSPSAVSWVGAAGLWQFMPPTAKGLGLTVNSLVDERRDPYRSTPLALDFLSGLREQFGSWFLALAAYNAGPGRMERILRQQAPGEERHDGLFWDVRGQLPRETRDFIPRFLAAARIARDPGAYGFEDVQSDEALAFDRVHVPDATSLDVVARAAGTDLATLQSLNPKLVRGLTPAGVATGIRVPPGMGAGFADNYAGIPEEERVTFVEHRVAPGETLGHIAILYGVSVDDLQAANPRIQPRRMQIGQLVTVPRAPSVRGGSPGESGGGKVQTEGELLLYTVRSGDSLGAIAARHGVGLGNLLRWNGMSQDAVIHPGDEVRIYTQVGR